MWETSPSSTELLSRSFFSHFLMLEFIYQLKNIELLRPQSASAFSEVHEIAKVY